MLVTWRAIPKAIVGPWAVYYYPGEEVVTHLAKRSGGVTYASTWWNAKGDDVKAPDSRDLPTTPGETVVPTPEPVKRLRASPNGLPQGTIDRRALPRVRASASR